MRYSPPPKKKDEDKERQEVDLRKDKRENKWIWSTLDKVKAPKKAWKQLKLSGYNLTPLDILELFGEGDTLHDFARIIKHVKEIEGAAQLLDWTEVIKKSFDKAKNLHDSVNGARIRKCK